MKQISISHPKIKKLQNLSSYLYQLINQGQLFEMNLHEKTHWDKRINEITDKIRRLEVEIKKFKINKIHRRRGSTVAQRILFIPQIARTTQEELAGKRIEKLLLISHNDLEKRGNNSKTQNV